MRREHSSSISSSSEFTSSSLLITFLARYYYKIPLENVTNLKYIIAPVLALFAPVVLVMSQPDLGTAVIYLSVIIPMLYWSGFSKNE